MKTHKTIKKLLKLGFDTIEIKGENINVRVDRILTSEEFDSFYDNFANSYSLIPTTEFGNLLIIMTKR